MFLGASIASLLFLILVPATVNSKGYGIINLNGTEIEKTFYIDTIVTHKEQFECYDTNITGKRALLRFDIVINNFSNESARFTPYVRPLKLNYALYDLTAGSYFVQSYINISCIRDTTCYGLDEGNSNEMTPFFYPCDHSGISSNCQQRAWASGDCRWIDITGANLFHVYRLTISLEKPIELAEARGGVDSTPFSTVFSLANIQRKQKSSTFDIVLSVLLFGGFSASVLIFARVYNHCKRKQFNALLSKKQK
jgi:Lysyl oxidase